MEETLKKLKNELRKCLGGIIPCVHVYRDRTFREFIVLDYNYWIACDDCSCLSCPHCYERETGVYNIIESKCKKVLGDNYDSNLIIIDLSQEIVSLKKEEFS